jgi:DNA-binding transcriptional LysR family regulator
MNLHHLRIFIKVCELGNMTRAAEDLYLSQPSISQAINELEQYYGVRLFERLNRRLYITAAGERLRTYAIHILNLSEQARLELADLNRGGSLRLGASLTIGAYIFPELAARYKSLHPNVDVFTRVDNTGLIEKLILEDQLDLGLVEGPAHSPHIHEEAYLDDVLVFIVSPRHPLAQMERVSLNDLARYPLVVREKGSGTMEIFEQSMQQAGVSWSSNGVFNNNESLKKAVIANLGIAVISEIAILEEVQQGRLVRLTVDQVSLKRKFNLIYHKQKFFTGAMLMFKELLFTETN